jgi:hypothetical protein
MASNIPPQTLQERPPRSLTRIVVRTILILLGLYGGIRLLQYMMDGDSDPDRPPIIISSGSVYVDVKEGDWENKGGKGYKHAFKGKDVKSFSATTGLGPNGYGCKVDGKTIVVSYGANSEITFTRKGKFLGIGKNHAFAQFQANANVSHPSTGRLEVTTNDSLVSFRNENGDNCVVIDKRLEIAQKH